MLKPIVAGISAVLLSAFTVSAQAAEPIKIGFITEFSGPLGILGEEMANGFKLALGEAGETIGGRPVQALYADDEAKPDIARQIADRMIEKDHIQILTGTNLSNMLLAIAKPVLDTGVFLISNNAGPSQLAGKQCHPHFFSVSHQNDTFYEALGLLLKQKDIGHVYFLAPNYPAGRDMMTGLKRTYTADIVGENFTQLNGLDYAPAISDVRSKSPQSVVFFYPGGMGINFVKQYAQSGLLQSVPLFTGPGAVDETSFKALGDSSLGIVSVVNWTDDLGNAASKQFSAHYAKVYGRPPSIFAAMAYDTGRLIDAAAKKVDGKIEDKAAFQKALETVDFGSVRGSFRFNTNHFPIQDFLNTVVTKRPDGSLYLKLAGTIVHDLKDAYAPDCVMTQ